MKKKTITIEVFTKSKDGKPKFILSSKNMLRYEIIGILELASAGIKNECINGS